MSEIKSFFNSFFLAIVLSLGVFSFASAQEDEQIGTILKEDEVIVIESEEIIISGDEDGGEEGAVLEVEDLGNYSESEEISVFNENDISDDIEGFKREDLVMPNGENAIEQELIENETNRRAAEETTAEEVTSGDNEESPFSAMILVFIGIPLAVALFFIIRKYIEAHK